MSPHQMWGGRFAQPLDSDLLAFTASFAVDRRLLRWDILASIAHARMLGDRGIIPASDARAIEEGLRGILADVEAGRLEVAGAFEDVHSFIEGTLYDRIGAPAGRLHTARSRNDQVVTAFRLFVKEQMIELVDAIRGLMVETADRAAASVEIVMPGFTHFQHAQPVRLAHHLLAYVWMLDRDADRCMTCYRRADVLPLGSGALAGVGYPIDRAQVAEALGFARISENSIDATSDRDFAIDAVVAAAVLMVHLSRWAAEIVAWASEEFGFLRLADSVAHGSSIMPQKKNPDAAELIRGRAGRAIGNLVALLATLKGLPAGYQSDLQEDKVLVFDALDAARGAVGAMQRLLRGIEFVPERLAAAARTGLLTATEVADYLVRKQVPFREAHALAGRIVQAALAQRVQLWELPLQAYRAISPLFGQDIYDVVTVEASVEAKRAPGGTARAPVAKQLVTLRERLDALTIWVEETRRVQSRPQALLER